MRIALHMVFAGLLAASLLLTSNIVRAASDEEFYSGRAVTIFQSAGAGGIYSAYSIVFAPYLEKHIPGNPTIVVDFMPGAGGIRAIISYQRTEAMDLPLGLVHSSVPFAPLYANFGCPFRSHGAELDWGAERADRHLRRLARIRR